MSLSRARLWAALLASIAFSALPLAARAADAPYDIHVIASLTGGGAFLGSEEQQSLKLAEPAFNKSGGIHGRPIRFVFHDDQSNPQIAVQLANEVLATRPAVMLGSSLVAACNAMTPLVANGPVLYCFSPGIHPPAGSYVFTSGVSTYDQANALMRFFRLKGWTKLALMTSTDATGQDADRGFDELLALPENKGIQVVEHAHFDTKDVSVAAQIERVKAAKPQVFIGWSTGAPSATIFRGAAQSALDLPVGTTGGNMTYAQMDRFAAFLPKEFFLPSSEWAVGDDTGLKLPAGVAAKQTEFYTAFKAAGLKPDEGSVLSWDPAAIVVDALRALPEGATAQQLRDYLVHLKGAPGIDGVYDFEKSPQRGLSLDNVIVTRWEPKEQRWPVVAGPTGIPLGH
jgi:branched-chain amino acid transport system substrate-binding protein